MPEYFTLEEVQDTPDVDFEYTEERVEAVAAAVVSIIEREVGTSFIARTVTDEVHDGGGNAIILRSPYVLSVTSATEDGVAVTDSLVVRNGVVRKVSGYSVLSWNHGYGNVTVTYEAGYSATPPADVKEQALRATRARLLETADDASMNDRRTSLNTDMGVINFTTAGENRPTGYPTVDEMILGWKRRLASPKVA